MLAAGLSIAAAITGCGGAKTTSDSADLTRPRLYELLKSHDLLHPERHLIHFHHTCDLIIGGQRFPVADVQETIPHPMTAAGLNRIIVFSPARVPVQKIEYVLNRPLFCVENRLYVYGDLRLSTPTGDEEGNVLTFSEGGNRIAVSHVEPQSYPVPETRSRKDYGQ